MRIELNGGDALLPTQDVLLSSDAYIRAIFGGWGSGKTRGAALCFLANCLANPWAREVYGDDRPFSIVMGTTRNVLRDSAHRELRALTPSALIARERTHPDWEWDLVTGHRIVFRTVKGLTEGASACGVWVDEVHLVPTEARWLNYQSRAREPRARRRLVLASGLPEHGWLQSVFDGYPDAEHATVGRGASVRSGNRLTLFASSLDNHYLPAEVLEEFRRSASGKTAAKYIDGRWMTPERLVYFEFDPRVHIVDDPGSRDQPVEVGLDVGDKSAVVFFQHRQRSCKNEAGRRFVSAGLHVVDELAPRQVSTEDVCRQIRDRGWLISPAKSALYVDPTIRRDEINAIRRVFPDVPLVRKSRRGRADSTEAGHHAINAALRDADRNVRLTIGSHLPRDEDSLYYAILNFRRGPNGLPHRDDKIDHKVDALRYPVAHLMPAARTSHRVAPRAA